MNKIMDNKFTLISIGSLLLFFVFYFLVPVPEDGLLPFLLLESGLLFSTFFFSPWLTSKKLKFDKDFFYLLLLWIVPIILFFKSLMYGFSNWDDPTYVYQNYQIQHFSFDNYFTSGFKGMYQPFVLLSFYLDHSIGELSPQQFHQSNLLLHLFNGSLVFILMKRWFKNSELGVFVAILFSVHAMHVENVVWVTARKDLLFSLFYLLALLQFTKHRDSEKQWALNLSLLFFILAAMTKAQAVSLVLVLPLIDKFLYKKAIEKKELLQYLPFLLISILFGALLLFLAEGEGTSVAWTERLILSFYALQMYLVKLVLPIGLSAIYPFPESMQLYHYGSIVLLAALLFFLWKKRKNGQILFASGLIIVQLALLLPIFPNSYFYMADRYSYLASIGVFILFYFAIESLLKKKKLYFLLLYVFVMLFFSFQRIDVWSSSLSLWNDVLDKHPRSIEALNNRGFAYYAQGKPEDALRDFQKALKIDPEKADSWANRGAILVESGYFDQALVDLDKALEINPDHSTAYYNRSLVFQQMGQTQNALDDLETCLYLDPYHADALLTKGAIYLNQGEFSKAYKDLSDALKINPNSYLTYANRGLANIRMNNETGALADFNAALKINPKFADAWSNKGMIYLNRGNYAEALTAFNYAIEYNPNMALAYLNRGRAFIGMGNQALACKDFNTANQYGLQQAQTEIQKHCLAGRN